jgi:hypothetical protein
MTAGCVLNCGGGTTVGPDPLLIMKKGLTQTLATLRTTLLVRRKRFALIVIKVNGKFRLASATHKLERRIQRTSIVTKRDDSIHILALATDAPDFDSGTCIAVEDQARSAEWQKFVGSPSKPTN